MKDIYIFGTCRVCYPYHEKIIFQNYIRGNFSRHYKSGSINVYTQPVNYTTKLIDVYDSILYMKGKLYQNLDPNTNENLQSIFFRCHPKLNFIKPNTHPINLKIDFGKIVIEICSIKQYIINTKKYGQDFYLKNLPWKIHTGFELNKIKFNKEDFIIKKFTKNECFEILDKIREEVNCPILIIGPYISNNVPDFVNEERIQTQNILKEYTKLNNLDYFDLSELIKTQENIEIDELHFNNDGYKVMNNVIYEFIVK